MSFVFPQHVLSNHKYEHREWRLTRKYTFAICWTLLLTKDERTQATLSVTKARKRIWGNKHFRTNKENLNRKEPTWRREKDGWRTNPSPITLIRGKLRKTQAYGTILVLHLAYACHRMNVLTLTLIVNLWRTLHRMFRTTRKLYSLLRKKEKQQRKYYKIRNDNTNGSLTNKFAPLFGDQYTSASPTPRRELPSPLFSRQRIDSITLSLSLSARNWELLLAYRFVVWNVCLALQRRITWWCYIYFDLMVNCLLNNEQVGSLRHNLLYLVHLLVVFFC